MTHLEHSVVSDRSWQIIHSDIKGILLGLWYRPSGANARDISGFGEDFSRLSVDTMGARIVGDMNIWQKSWLKHSPSDTRGGANLHCICKKNIP